MKKLLLFSALILGCGAVFAVTYLPSEIKHMQPLNLKRMNNDPMEQFQMWFKDAKQSMSENASIFVLATVNSSCEPVNCAMMAKSIDDTGFAFFGDDEGYRFRNLMENPAAAATFVWLDQQRQVSFSGKAVPVSEREREEAFNEIPRAAQIASNISHSGKPLLNADELKQKWRALDKQYQNRKIPMPESWVGYHFQPEVIAFWQAGENGLHSRVIYTLQDGKWMKKMLQP